jgi:hypothetical protein
VGVLQVSRRVVAEIDNPDREIAIFNQESSLSRRSRNLRSVSWRASEIALS